MHSTLWRSFFGIVQQSLLLTMTPLHCALSALETLEAASAKAVERLSVSRTAPTLGDNMRWSVSCLAGDQQATSKFDKKLMFRIGEDGRQKAVGVLRLLLLRDQGSNIWQQIGFRMLLYRYINLSQPDLLMDHETERRRNPEEWEMFQTEVVDVIRTVRPDVDDALVHKLIGILNTNSVSFNFKKDARK